MKTLVLLLSLSFSFFCNQCYAEQDTIKVKSVEEAINISLKNFRQKIANDKAIIYCITEVRLNKGNIDFAKNDFIVENSINAKQIDYKTDKFVFKFVVSINNGHTFISVIQWRLKKKSRKEIELTNLMSGSYYEVVMQ